MGTRFDDLDLANNESSPQLTHPWRVAVMPLSPQTTVLDIAGYLRRELRDGVNDVGEKVVSLESLTIRRKPAIDIDDRQVTA